MDWDSKRERNVCKDCKTTIWKNSIRCRACANKYRIGTHYGAESKLGKLNPAWKGGISDGYYRRIFLKNFKPRCYICNSSKNICAHHKDGNRKNNNISNLIPVCHRCHELIHQRWKKK